MGRTNSGYLRQGAIRTIANSTTSPGIEIRQATNQDTRLVSFIPAAYNNTNGIGSEHPVKRWNFSFSQPANFGSALRPDMPLGFGYNISNGGGNSESTEDASFGITFEDYYNPSGTIRQFEWYLQSCRATSQTQVRAIHINISYPTLASNTAPDMGMSLRYGPTSRLSFEYFNADAVTQYFSMAGSLFIINSPGAIYGVNNNKFLKAEDNPASQSVSMIYMNSSNQIEIGQAGFPVKFTDAATFSAAGKTITFTKGGAAATSGTFVCNGASNVTITTTAASANMVLLIGLNTVGGTVGNTPHITTISAGSSFTVAGTAGDTSTYNWAIINLA